MHILLINSPLKVKVCRKGFAYLKRSNLEEGWRLHSAGYAVKQYTSFGKIKTLYMHKLFAEKLLAKPDYNDEKKFFVSVKNGNKLDCQLQNLYWATMSEIRRHCHKSEQYRGVSKDGNRYRAVIYDKGERIYLGIFVTPEEAAEAYDEESFKRFGLTPSLNFVERYDLQED